MFLEKPDVCVTFETNHTPNQIAARPTTNHRNLPFVFLAPLFGSWISFLSLAAGSNIERPLPANTTCANALVFSVKALRRSRLATSAVTTRSTAIPPLYCNDNCNSEQVSSAEKAVHISLPGETKDTFIPGPVCASNGKRRKQCWMPCMVAAGEPHCNRRRSTIIRRAAHMEPGKIQHSVFDGAPGSRRHNQARRLEPLARSRASNMRCRRYSQTMGCAEQELDWGSQGGRRLHKHGVDAQRRGDTRGKKGRGPGYYRHVPPMHEPLTQLRSGCRTMSWCASIEILSRK